MRVAVVGTGIAGLGAAYLLSRRHEVEVFEEADYVGGHTNTIPTPLPDGRVLALDTGFIVHNRENYPNLIRLFDELGVRTQESEMSFSVSCARCGLEYSGARPWTQWQNLRSPAFIALLGEIVRFMRTAERGGRPSRGRDAGPVRGAVPATRGGFATTSSSRSPHRSGRPRPPRHSISRRHTRSASSRTTGCSGSAGSGGAP